MLQNYIGVSLIQAQPVSDNGVEGYTLDLPNGQPLWMAKEAFEMAYMPLRLCMNPKVQCISTEDVTGIVAQIKAQQIDPKTTLVNATLKTGFELYNTASCVDAENYSTEFGAKIAMNKINDQIWFALGFVLQWAKYGLKHTSTQETVTGDDHGIAQ